MSNNSSQITLAQLQRDVKELKFQMSSRRITVSRAAIELKTFCLENAYKDPLLLGVPSSNNPFRPPKSCALL